MGFEGFTPATPPEIAAGYRAAGWWRAETLPARLRAVCGALGERVALVDGGLQLSYADFASLVERVAGHLATLGVQPGDVVSWQLPGWWEAAVLHHAALRIGAVPNPLNPIFRGRELRFVLEEAQPRVLVVPASFRGFDHADLATELLREMRSLTHVITVRGSAARCLEFGALVDEPPLSEPPPEPHDASAIALLLYTSGTTSDPKGVLHSHETLLYEIRSLQEIHTLTPDDRYLCGSPVAHIAGLVYGVLMPFALGTSTAFMERWDPAAAAELIEREHITFQTGAPAFLLTLAEARGDRDLSSFRLFSTGGASIPTDLVREAGERIGCVVKRAYGSTEVPTLTATRFEDPDDVRIGTDGAPIGPAEMRIVEGEICALSPEMFLGYRNAALNDCFDADGWFRTGDLGAVDDKSNLRVTGRLKDVIIRGGENISAKEIEDLLVAHPAVAEVAVVGVPDAVLGERACAVVVPRVGVTFTFEEMISYLSSREIATQKLPERLEIRPSLPHTESGKVQKALLREELR